MTLLVAVSRYLSLSACLALTSGTAVAEVYNAFDFNQGIRSYEAMHGNHRNRTPRTEGAAFEFLGYLKASVAQHNGREFCIQPLDLSRAVTVLVQRYNNHVGAHFQDPQLTIVNAWRPAFPCRAVNDIVLN